MPVTIKPKLTTQAPQVSSKANVLTQNGELAENPASAMDDLKGWDDSNHSPEDAEKLKQDAYDAWNFFLAAKPDITSVPRPESPPPQVTIPVFTEVTVPESEAAKIIQREISVEEAEVDRLQAQVLEEIRVDNTAEGLDATGRLSFRAEPTDTETDRVSNLRGEEKTEAGRQPKQAQMVAEDRHTLAPQPFDGRNLDVVRHHDLVDFPYFFGTMRALGSGIAKFTAKNILSVRNVVDVKDAIGDLFFEQILGLGEKKTAPKEAEEKKQRQATNFRIFYDALRRGTGSMSNPDRQRGVREKIASLNKQSGRANLSYAGVLDQATGEARGDVLIDAEKANSEKSQEQIKEERKRKLMFAAKNVVKKGPGISLTADRAHNFNNAAKLSG